VEKHGVLDIGQELHFSPWSGVKIKLHILLVSEADFYEEVNEAQEFRGNLREELQINGSEC
jgi:hypothetical protein